MVTIPDASPASRQQFDDAVADPFINLLVIGTGSAAESSARNAEVRADSVPGGRQVIWVRDPGLLSQPERDLYTRQGAALACVLSLAKVPVVWLDPQQAQDFTDLELAFGDAALAGNP
jgi:hypothetical protein